MRNKFVNPLIFPSRAIPLCFLAIVIFRTIALSEELPKSSSQGSHVVATVEDAQVSAIQDIETPVTIDGQISRFHVAVGDQVMKGQKLVSLRSEEAVHAVRATELELQLAKLVRDDLTAITMAQRRFQMTDARLQRLESARSRSPASVSLDQVEEAKLARNEADAEWILAKQAQLRAGLECEIKNETLRIHQDQLLRYTVVSPIEGLVVDSHFDVGQWARQGDDLVQIVNLNRLRIETFVNSKQLDSADVNSVARFQPYESSTKASKISTNEDWMMGQVTFVSPLIDPVDDQVVVWVELDNRNHQLRPGTRGRLEVLAKE